MNMENTIENAEKYFASCPINESNSVSAFGYAMAVNASLYERIAELEKQVEELGGQSILNTLQRNKALRDDNAALQREIASLRSRLEDCNRKRITGSRI